MPTSAAVLKAHEELCGSGQEYLGVPQIDYPPVTQEEREAALIFSRELKVVLLKKSKEFTSSFSVPTETFNIDEYLANYRKWLEQRVEQDERDRANGLAPVPRSECERLAVYMSLPALERRRIARKGEWTKLNTKNM